MSEQVSVNPFAPPDANLIDSPLLREVRIEGKSLVVPKGWVSPPICLKSGETENLAPIRKIRLTWAHPGYLVLVFVGLIIYVLVYFLVRRGGKINYYFSNAVAARYGKRRAIAWAVFLVGVAMVGYGASNNASAVAGGGVLAILVAAVLALSLCRPFYARKIKGDSIWLGGISRDAMEKIVSMNQRNEFLTAAPMA